MNCIVRLVVSAVALVTVACSPQPSPELIAVPSTTETTATPDTVPEPEIVVPTTTTTTVAPLVTPEPVEPPTATPDVPVPSTTPLPEPVEPPQPPATAITEETPVDPPVGGSPLDQGGIELGGITPDGRADNGYQDNRHQGDRTLRVYVQRTMRPLASHVVSFLNEWNRTRSTDPRHPYFVSAIYVDDCNWRGTGTVVICGVTDDQMVRLTGKPYTGFAKAKNQDRTRHHLIDGSAIVINVEKLAEGRATFTERRVLLHEYGHVLGLAHQGADGACGPESDPASLMSYCPGSDSFDDDDLAALDRLYAH